MATYLGTQYKEEPKKEGVVYFPPLFLTLTFYSSSPLFVAKQPSPCISLQTALEDPFIQQIVMESPQCTRHCSTGCE